MIEVKNISKKFKKNIEKNKVVEFFADNDISFTAEEGEVLGILGLMVQVKQLFLE